MLKSVVTWFFQCKFGQITGQPICKILTVLKRSIQVNALFAPSQLFSYLTLKRAKRCIVESDKIAHFLSCDITIEGMNKVDHTSEMTSQLVPVGCKLNFQFTVPQVVNKAHGRREHRLATFCASCMSVPQFVRVLATVKLRMKTTRRLLTQMMWILALPLNDPAFNWDPAIIQSFKEVISRVYMRFSSPANSTRIYYIFIERQ